VGQQAFPATGVEIGKQDRDGLADDPATVGRGAVAQQGEPGTFKVNEFLGGQVNGDLLGVLLPAAGLTLISPVRAGRGWPQELSDPRQAYSA
jgi:hypothetical protein